LLGLPGKPALLFSRKERAMARPVERRPYEELARSFEASPVFHHVHAYDLYRNWLEAVWAFLNATCHPEAYKECLDKYTFDEGGEFGRLLGVYTTAVEREPFRDILGELFMRLDVKSAAAGQYFSPGPIAEMMARMQFSRESFERLVSEKGEVSVYDPAVGSGVMLLAFGKVVHEELGRWGVSKLRLYGQDIDMRCVLMCKIQLRMNGLDAFGRLAGLFGIVDSTAGTSEGTTETTGHGGNLLPASTTLVNEEDIADAGAAEGPKSEQQETSEENIPMPDLEDAVVLQPGNTEQRKALMEQLTLF
jgi:hypothetical protein